MKKWFRLYDTLSICRFYLINSFAAFNTYRLNKYLRKSILWRSWIVYWKIWGHIDILTHPLLVQFKRIIQKRWICIYHSILDVYSKQLLQIIAGLIAISSYGWQEVFCKEFLVLSTRIKTTCITGCRRRKDIENRILFKWHLSLTRLTRCCGQQIQQLAELKRSNCICQFTTNGKIFEWIAWLFND